MSEYEGTHRGYAAGPWGPYEPKHAAPGDRWIREALRIEQNMATVRARIDAEAGA